MLARLGPRLGIEPRKPGTNSTRPSPCKTIEQVEIMLEKDLGGARVLGDARTCELGGEDISLANLFQSLPSFSMTDRLLTRTLLQVSPPLSA